MPFILLTVWMEWFSMSGSFKYGLLAKQAINCESCLLHFAFSIYLKLLFFIFFSLCSWCSSLGQVDSIPNPTKEQLIDVARRHFMLLVLVSNSWDYVFFSSSIFLNNCVVDSPFLVVESNCFVLLLKQLDELQVLVGFVQAAKRLKTVCKWPLWSCIPC